jgi:hypothetical protein
MFSLKIESGGPYQARHTLWTFSSDKWKFFLYSLLKSNLLFESLCQVGEQSIPLFYGLEFVQECLALQFLVKYFEEYLRALSGDHDLTELQNLWVL